MLQGSHVARPVEQDVLGSLRKAGARACIPHMSSCVRRAARRRACPWPRQATGLLGWRCVPLFGSPSAAPCCPSKGQPVGGLSTASRRQVVFVTSARGAPATSPYLAASPAHLSKLIDTLSRRAALLRALASSLQLQLHHQELLEYYLLFLSNQKVHLLKY